MSNTPTALLFLNDWRVDPDGANCGGGEIATISLAEALVSLGYRTICCGNLSVPEGTYRGVEYWSFGESYDLESLLPRIDQLDPFFCFAATLVHPFLLLKRRKNCLARILINHSPGIVSSGLEPRTVSNLVDFHVCVSEAQKKLILMRGDVPEHNMRVIKNGYDPVLFSYSGPEQRDFRRMMFAGRLEAPKGIHHLLGAFVRLKQEFPDLKLDIFGSQNHWPEVNAEIARLEQQFPDLKFHGKVNRSRIAEQMQKSGILVFPSLSFETAGLVVLEAQGTGCPVVANNIGGVPEYIKFGCGVLTTRPDVEELTSTLRELLANESQLKSMSLKCKGLEHSASWVCTARELLKLANQVVESNATINSDHTPEIVKQLQPLKRSAYYKGVSYQQLVEDHEVIASGNLVSDQQITQIIEMTPNFAAAHLWQGLRFDHKGDRVKARECYQQALILEQSNWQALLRLILNDAEAQKLDSLPDYVSQLLQNYPDFYLRPQLEKLLSETKKQLAGGYKYEHN